MKNKLIFFLFFCFLGQANAQDHYAMYGVYFYNFTKYIEWPAEYNQGDFEIMVLGKTPMLDEFKKLAERKKVNGRSFKITEIGNVNEIKKCHVVFIATSSINLLADVARKVKGLPVLLISEKEGAAKKGAVINYVEKDGKPAFEINIEAANEHKLKVFSELTKWAIVI